MKIAVQVQPATESQAQQRVQYRWDADTEILSAQVHPGVTGEGMSGSVGLEGSDGSWIVLDVSAGQINGVEIAIWPDIRRLNGFLPPSQVEDACVTVPSRRSQPNIASLEMTAHLIAEADPQQRNIHFRLGKPAGARTVRLARDLLLDVDDKSQISGLWLLNVPPAPASISAHASVQS